jgi:DNA-binding transcriptional MerR regulator
MNSSDPVLTEAIQLLEPDPDAVYTIEAVEHLVNVPRRMILVYYKYGLVSPVVDPACGGYYFNDEAIRALRRIEYLRSVCGMNMPGIRLILDLMNEVERLRAELRFQNR